MLIAGSGVAATGIDFDSTAMFGISIEGLYERQIQTARHHRRSRVWRPHGGPEAGPPARPGHRRGPQEPPYFSTLALSGRYRRPVPWRNSRANPLDIKSAYQH